MKFKVGDKVRVRKDLEVYRMYGRYEFDEGMEQYKGEQAIIVAIDEDGYILDIDGGAYFWVDEMLEPVAETIADSDENKDESIDNTVETIDKSIDQFTKDDLKFGDIVTLRFFSKYEDCETLLINNKLYFNDGSNVDLKEYKEDLTNFETNFDIMKVQRYIHYSQYGDTIYTLTTLYERKEEILNEKEKEYLSKFIEPFRNQIREIIKKDYGEEEWLHIVLNKINGGTEAFSLPSFNKNTMYKGMEMYKEYTLKELGL